MHLPNFKFLSDRHSGSAEPAADASSYTAFIHKAFGATKEKLKLLKPLQRQITIGAAAVVGVVAAYKAASHVHKLVQRRRRRQLLRQCEQDAELHVFILPRSPWSPSLSPACTRVEAYLRANGIPYKAIETLDATGAPSGELPFLVYKHARMDQLPRIFEFLSSEFSVSIDDALTREERAIGAALRRTLEYSMERFLYRTVFIDHPTLAVTHIARALHISHLRARLAVRQYARKLNSQLAITAYGALVSEQYENEFLLDCEALEVQIGDKQFLFSNAEVTSYDCAVYALLVPFAYMGKYTALSTAYMAVANSPVLMGYVARMTKRLFADVAAQFDAAATTCATSSATSASLSSGEEEGGDGGSCADSEELHRGLEVSDEETKQPEKTVKKEEVQPEAARSATPTKAAATTGKRKKPSPKAAKAKKAPASTPPRKGKPAGASPKKP
ncbi:putative mitochondrial hypothetical protein [Leptomonas pyrrhocoris]|uniref:Thioredoxin-like fold domain-containing protein n=1 Tax=Leptomonas pyrrhocoris TaxID=157538 RepID=A0A0M9FZT4_LEPPY|nr:putative mitochondrial hypothetical protein [Leptomonas pyrrhocoris]XP_015657685.1 putative mitochondrial hypothetical protein [Leptomonas pyrrhocoris]KPA79245.1 putative mitochondrial hypothetical protein [Leptomonas pyrrhocoris]KPA79246.1 putative mitochondrial hypothetical protein [Leptomonas pyrrhocoris]|eukprot:XP_015657684.1 putative mitochondrial hypothetical protein [Leptomonas pyrrhocoris]